MADSDRERIGPFVVTSARNLSADGIICAQCQKQLSSYDKASDTHSPSAEDLLEQGAVPVPNFGWFCTQACGDEYGRAHKIGFQRNSSGKISYY